MVTSNRIDNTSPKVVLPPWAIKIVKEKARRKFGTKATRRGTKGAFGKSKALAQKTLPTSVANAIAEVYNEINKLTTTNEPTK